MAAGRKQFRLFTVRPWQPQTQSCSFFLSFSTGKWPLVHPVHLWGVFGETLWTPRVAKTSTQSSKTWKPSLLLPGNNNLGVFAGFLVSAALVTCSDNMSWLFNFSYDSVFIVQSVPSEPVRSPASIAATPVRLWDNWSFIWQPEWCVQNGWVGVA